MTMAARILTALLLSTLTMTYGCISAYKAAVGTDSSQFYHRIYAADFQTTWQAVLEAIKNNRIDVSNPEAGTVRTKWTDNTAEKNFSDSFTTSGAYLKAEFRMKISVSAGTFNGEPSVKIVIQKDQRIQRDVLEGWRAMETDGIDENTLLYRIGRLITVKQKLAKIEEERARKELQRMEAEP